MQNMAGRYILFAPLATLLPTFYFIIPCLSSSLQLPPSFSLLLFPLSLFTPPISLRALDAALGAAILTHIVFLIALSVTFSKTSITFHPVLLVLPASVAHR